MKHGCILKTRQLETRPAITAIPIHLLMQWKNGAWHPKSGWWPSLSSVTLVLFCTSFLSQGQTQWTVLPTSISYFAVFCQKFVKNDHVSSGSTENTCGHCIRGQRQTSCFAVYQVMARFKGYFLDRSSTLQSWRDLLDFWLFPHLKRDLRGIEFETESELKTYSLGSLNALPEEVFKSCYVFQTLICLTTSWNEEGMRDRKIAFPLFLFKRIMLTSGSLCEIWSVQRWFDKSKYRQQKSALFFWITKVKIQYA